MPKALCLGSMVISVLVLILFLLDLIFGLMGEGMISMAPFKFCRPWLDVTFLVISGMWTYLSWVTFKEQV